MKSLKNLLFGKEFDKQVAFVGLQNAGKTTLVKHLKETPTEDSTTYVPTMGLSMERFSLGETEVIAADLGGQKSFRESFWKPLVEKSSAVCFVFDSADTAKVSEAGEVLETVLSWVHQNSTFLFLANKKDLENALALEEIIKQLGLKEKIKQRPHSFGVYQISALTGEGIEDSFEWLNEQLFKNKSTDVEKENN
ncbi:MAG: GTPase HflX [Candidatus Heimdallarchaeota archaeon LC_3]|nr:MAG: GTPase HflX [Candidatus Heimdallarchaeota archaeon LC_3]